MTVKPASLVVVLGMHRGGTSAITRGLQVIGIELGNNLMPPAPGINEKGFWEDLEIHALNKSVLSAAGFDWHSIDFVADDALANPAAQGFKSAALSLLRAKLEGVQSFGIKDPRMPRLLPFWREVFAELGSPVHYVIACRNPLSVAASLAKRDNFDAVKSHCLWLDHMFASVAGTAGCSRIVIDYDRLMDDASGQLQRLAAFLGRGGSLNPAALEEFEGEFLEGALRHTKFSAADLLANEELPQGVAELYGALQDLAADRLGGDSPQLTALLDRLALQQRQLRPLLGLLGVFDNRAAERARSSASLTRLVAERDRQIADSDGRIEQQARRIDELCRIVDDYRLSNSWRVTRPLRYVSGRLQVVRRAVGVLAQLRRRGGGLPAALAKTLRILRSEGLAGIRHRLILAQVAGGIYHRGDAGDVAGTVHDSVETRYQAWLRVNVFTEEAAAAVRAALTMRRGELPLISVIVPVYNTPVALLERAIDSVANQVFENWELCIADDASTDAQTVAALQEAARREPRIRLMVAGKNGNISAATNMAAAGARGDFLVFLDHDDELTADALAEIAFAIVDHADVDYIYSDEDKLAPDGRLFAPQFKPGWSPTLLLSYMYLGHVKAVRRALFERLGGFRTGFEGSQDYDFALRVSEAARRVVHLPKVLYHWRVVSGSTAASGNAKPAAFEAGRRAVAEAFARRGIAADIEQPRWARDGAVGIFTPRFADNGPRVTIIIPTRNRVDLLRACIESLQRTTYADYEVVIVDNESDDPQTLAYLAALPHRVLRIANRPGAGFSFARINNAAVREVATEYVLFLNNDTQVRAPGWLSQMMGYARMDRVGAVGARLLYRNNTIQHAGVVHGYAGGLAGHAFRTAPAREHGYLGYSMVAREYAAVTAACLLTPRALFLAQGGFDEEHFAVAYNDVDYCYRLGDAGYRSIYCASAELLHDEGRSRGFADAPGEIAEFRRRNRGRVDRCYNPNLSLDDEHFRVRPWHAPVRAACPPRAVMVTHNLNYEGAPLCMLEMAVGLKRRGEIDPLVLSPVDGPLRAEYAAAGIAVRLIEHPLAAVYAEAVFEQHLDALVAVFREVGAEVVYGNTLLTFWAIAAGERAGLPTLWNPRESEPWQTYFDFLGPQLRQRAYACFAYPYRIIFVAEATRRAWAPLQSGFNYTVVHDGLEPAQFEARLGGLGRAEARAQLGVAADDVVVLLLGTVCERKGQLDLVQALRELPPAVAARLRAFIVGDRASPYSIGLHRELDALPAALRQRLEVVAETGDVAPYYRAADIALCTSRIESYPRVVLEAMACGLPIVTTPVFGIREQVREGINGVFYEPGDTRALAAALAALVEDGAQRQQLGSHSRPVLDSLTSFAEMLDGYGRIFGEARYSRGRPYRPRRSERYVE
jgi:glycosyltransferase involved in cell wall biosynthesis